MSILRIFNVFKVLSDLVSNWLKLTFMAGRFFGMITGLAGGLGIGVALGLLFAPKSGEETREEIKEQAKKTVKDLNERSQHIRSITADFLTADHPVDENDNATRVKKKKTTTSSSSN